MPYSIYQFLISLKKTVHHCDYYRVTLCSTVYAVIVLVCPSVCHKPEAY